LHPPLERVGELVDLLGERDSLLAQPRGCGPQATEVRVSDVETDVAASSGQEAGGHPQQLGETPNVVRSRCRNAGLPLSDRGRGHPDLLGDGALGQLGKPARLRQTGRIEDLRDLDRQLCF